MVYYCICLLLIYCCHLHLLLSVNSYRSSTSVSLTVLCAVSACRNPTLLHARKLVVCVIPSFSVFFLRLPISMHPSLYYFQFHVQIKRSTYRSFMWAYKDRYTRGGNSFGRFSNHGNVPQLSTSSTGSPTAAAAACHRAARPAPGTSSGRSRSCSSGTFRRRPGFMLHAAGLPTACTRETDY